MSVDCLLTQVKYDVEYVTPFNVADPGGVDPDPTFKQKPSRDPAVKKNWIRLLKKTPDTDPTYFLSSI